MPSIGITEYLTPSPRAIACASFSDIVEVKREGIMTACTRAAPSASQASASTSAESTPPDSPITTPSKRCLST